MKFGMLKVLGSIACVLMSQGASAGREITVLPWSDQRNEGVFANGVSIDEVRTVSSDQDRRHILQALDARVRAAMTAGDIIDGLETAMILSHLSVHWHIEINHQRSNQ